MADPGLDSERTKRTSAWRYPRFAFAKISEIAGEFRSKLGTAFRKLNSESRFRISDFKSHNSGFRWPISVISDQVSKRLEDWRCGDIFS